MKILSKVKDTSAKIIPLYPNDRIDFIDAARGLLIMMVILGHSQFLYSRFLYWFHMPAFFIISGMLYRQPEETGDFISKKFFNLTIPYIAYGILIGLVGHFFYADSWDLHDFAHSLAVSIYNLLLWGGERLKGNLAVFWFINCFLLTIICFTLAKQFINNDTWVKVLAVLGFAGGYGLNIYIDRNLESRALPWDVNVVPYTFAYFAFGFYTKNVLKRFTSASIYWTMLPVALCTVLVQLELSNIIEFKLDLKYGVISNPVLGLIIPILFTLLVLFFSAHIRHTKLKDFLKFIGQNTLPIMYLHIVANFLYSQITEVAPAPYLFLIVGISIPLLLTSLFRKYKLTSMLFLGYNSKGLLNLIPLKHKARE